EPGFDQRYSREDIFRGADFDSIFRDMGVSSGFGDLFNVFFGDRDFEERQEVIRGRDLRCEVNITLEEALTLYRQIIETSGKIGDWQTRELFEKIYGEEEGHTSSNSKNTQSSKTKKKNQTKCHYLNGAKCTQTITLHS
ncbi:MAG: hypothetical protein ABSF44_16020, partial [Candidatus Bathyarchaeia archaeon]